MDRLVKTHLDRADNLDIGIEHLQHLIAGTCRGEVGEYERVDILAVKTGEGILLVAQLTVERKAQLHLTVNRQVRIVLLHIFSSMLYLEGSITLATTEVRVTDHAHNGLFIKELNAL